MSTKPKKTKTKSTSRANTKKTPSATTKSSARSKTKKPGKSATRRSKADVTSSAAKPVKMEVLADNIPDQLKRLPRWVTWNYERSGRKWSKVLQDPKTGWHGSSTDQTKWSDWPSTLEASAAADGVGITFGEVAPGTHLVGIDLDDARDPDTGAIDDWAMAIIRLLASYTEVSPSGTGLKVFCFGRLPAGARQNGNLECYEAGRYFCVTGHVLEGFAEIRTATEQLAVFHARFIDPPRNSWRRPDVEIAVEALKALALDRADDRGDWLTVGMALHSVDDSLLDVWDEWSMHSLNKYVGGECARFWKKFQRRADGKGISLGTLIHYAKSDGWVPPRDDEAEESAIVIGKLRVEVVPGSGVNSVATARFDGDVIERDKLDLNRLSAREKFIDKICEGRDIDRKELTQKLLDKSVALSARGATDSDDGDPPERTTAEELLQKMPEHIRRQARAMLESPNLLEQIIDDVQKIGVAGERTLIGQLYLILTSRLLPDPLSGIVQAPSSSGKSYCIAKTISLAPPEAVLQATSLTKNALYYFESDYLMHKLIVAGERSRQVDDVSQDQTRALRELQSNGVVTKVLPQGDDIKRTEVIEIRGPIAYLESTTLSPDKIFDEDLNRCLLLSADETKEQTRAIIDKLGARFAGAEGSDASDVIQKHHAAQRMLRQRAVVVPFAPDIGRHFCDDAITARRGYPQFVAMVKASALLFQFQRMEDESGRIVAEELDYQLARMLCSIPLGRAMGRRVSDAAIAFHQRATKWDRVQKASFSAKNAAEWDGKTTQMVGSYLRELSKPGVEAVTELSERRGNQAAQWSIRDNVDHAELLARDAGLPEKLK